MSILGNILGKIFPSFKTAEAAKPTSPTLPDCASSGVPAAPKTETAPTAMTPVDVEALLDGMASQNTQPLNWKTSIVDLMKLLGLDSSLGERKALAAELGYQQDMSDSAAMNVWLHRQVMNKLAANGGKVPADLRD